MKLLIVNIIAVFIFLAMPAFGQQQGNVNNQQQVQDTNSVDSIKANINAPMRKRDRFIDKDGDGINDNRCCGMGLHHGKGRNKGKGYGRHGCEQKCTKAEKQTEKKDENVKK